LGDLEFEGTRETAIALHRMDQYEYDFRQPPLGLRYEYD
jgi:hypothetical protein